jgi:cytochrome b
MKLLCENLIDESTTDFIQRIVVVVVLDVAVVVNVVLFGWNEIVFAMLDCRSKNKVHSSRRPHSSKEAKEENQGEWN